MIRSTKAGPQPRRHPAREPRPCRRARTLNEGRGLNPGDTETRQLHHHRLPVRSTKAGASTPATRCWNLTPVTTTSAQRRPGPQPRRHNNAPRSSSTKQPRSTKAGASTPATQGQADAHVVVVDRSTKAGASTPATHPDTARHTPAGSALNEGRGLNPGDTVLLTHHELVVHDRSTKAGASTPATRELSITTSHAGASAQRRPGPQPRRHPLEGVLDTTGHPPRSTKAGASTPATPTGRRARHNWPPTPLNEGRGLNPGDTRTVHHDLARRGIRSTKAGASTPATPTGRRARHNWPPTPLNEGRGLNPGDTLRCAGVRVGIDHRSTKAGASTPATPPLSGGGGAAGSLRSTKAGASTPATLDRPGVLDLHVVARSTKAGASTPATRSGARRSRCGRSPLNEGRGLNPGDTGRGGRGMMGGNTAQRRPGPQPRRHPPRLLRRGYGGWTLNEGRGLNPGDTRRGCYGVAMVVGRSTKAGASTPATLGGRPARWPPSRSSAQRRPGPQPRRHMPSKATRRSISTAQRRPGPQPRRHMPSKATRRSISTAQRRPGPQPRRHLPFWRVFQSPLLPLNEGRGLNPGDTAGVGERADLVVRSTKAGASTPATPYWVPIDRIVDNDAQRRPGPQPRRHPAVAVTPTYPKSAQRRPGPQPRRHMAPPSATWRCMTYAQRRPGPQPRRHEEVVVALQHRHVRSTKAGASTPATRMVAVVEAHGVVGAQRRPGPQPQRHLDTLLPADVTIRAQRRPGPQPRRHFRSCDTTPESVWTAQRRPGPQPRRHEW